MRAAILAATVGLLAMLSQPDSGNCQVTDLMMINSFEYNWNDSLAKVKASYSSELSPPTTPKSKYSWAANSFGACFGCGSKSYKEVKHDCIHKLPMKMTAGTYSKTMMGVFRVPETKCKDIKPLTPISSLGCGPPCMELRLLQGELTGCRCDHTKKIAFDVPKMVCQDNRNRTVSLSLCKFFYEKSQNDYPAVACDYAAVCSGKATWIDGNWTKCSHQNSNHQTRKVVCAVEPSATSLVYFLMHESACPADTKPTKMQFCARWAAERNFSKKCNCATRKVSRRVLCMRDLTRTVQANDGHIRKTPVDEAECSWHTKPDSERPCDRKQLFTDCGGSTS